MGVDDTLKLAKKIRLNILEMLYTSGSGHVGGSLSISDFLSVLYGGILRYDPNNPNQSDRDYFVLSKGHAGPALYAVLAAIGVFPAKDLLTINNIGTSYPSHPDRLKTLGVEATTGSLGQGFSMAAGLAAAAILNDQGQKVYCLVGDGELQEGQCWEAMQQVAHSRYTHFTLIIDDNGFQLDGKLDNICESWDLGKKVEAFGWTVLSVDGHDHHQIHQALLADPQGKAKAIVLKTQKGYGVQKLMESGAHHWKKGADSATDECMAQALEQLKREVQE